MKTLILVRHAKSDHGNSNLNDFDRPLNDKGQRDAVKMARLFVEKNIIPDKIISSPALRAIATADYFADALNKSFDEIQQEQFIYDRGANFIINFIKKLENSYNTVMLFGHNPDMTALATFLSGKYFENIPTCGLVCIDFIQNNWEDIDPNYSKLRFFEFPKNTYNA